MRNVVTPLIIGGFAAGLALAPLIAGAETNKPKPAVTLSEKSALEVAVYEELFDIGIHVPNLNKLSSAQLAGLLLTLTRESPNRDEAVTAIVANGDYALEPLDGAALDDMTTVRDVVEDALGRAGWSADVTQLGDDQVAALFTELAERGYLETQRINALTASES